MICHRCPCSHWKCSKKADVNWVKACNNEFTVCKDDSCVGLGVWFVQGSGTVSLLKIRKANHRLMAQNCTWSLGMTQELNIKQLPLLMTGLNFQGQERWYVISDLKTHVLDKIFFLVCMRKLFHVMLVLRIIWWVNRCFKKSNRTNPEWLFSQSGWESSGTLLSCQQELIKDQFLMVWLYWLHVNYVNQKFGGTLNEQTLISSFLIRENGNEKNAISDFFNGNI